MSFEFVIRHHQAYRAGEHHDLHLDGMSWAVPKGVPTLPSKRVLAVESTYHTPEQARFEGTIPRGEYGGGVSKVLDSGELQIIERRPNHIFFKLLGSKFTGNYHLQHWEAKKWLLWKAG